MLLLAPAKINLHLRVAPADGSGFHPLLTWMCTVRLFDTLTIEQAQAGQIRLECDDPTLPCNSTNLVLRAAEALSSLVQPTSGIQMRLQKRIPVGGGLGGGSSDAARVLLGLHRLWNLNWPIDRLTQIAAELGSDVPFFLYGPSSVCTGRGQHVLPVSCPKPRWATLVLPGHALPTAEVYRQFDRLGLGDPLAVSAQPPWEQWAELSAGPLLRLLRNDLEPAAFTLNPSLASLQRHLEQTLGRPVRMSGSGSSLFTLYDERFEAEQAAQLARNRHGVTALAVEIAPQLEDDLSATAKTT